jgi:energy-coupling factor transport system ATP-binding protein
MNRFLTRTSLFAYVTESHQPASEAFASSAPAVEAVSLRIRPASGAPDVLCGASFTVPLGETVLVAGADAAGKSTLLKAIAGVIPCVQGSVGGTLKLFGIPTKGLLISDFGKLVAYFSQDAGAHVLGLTVGQELRLAAASEAAMAEAVAALGLTDLLDRQTTMLSGGETVRLVLASVLARRAPLLLMDDPLDQLDRDGRKSLIAALHALRDQSPVTIILAEKTASTLRDLITTILLLEGGTVTTISRNNHRWDDPAWLSHLGLSNWSSPDGHPEIARSDHSIAGLRNLSVELDERLVVRNVTLDFQKGELVLVQGPNGSGKTTAMLALVGALDANIVAGERWSVKGTKFGYVFQDTALQFATATCLGEILLSRLARSTRRTQQADDAQEQLVWVGVPEDVDPFEIHPSRQKLLAFAAMAFGTDLVVVDEPTIGAASWAVERLLTRILKLRSEGKCIVLISHEERLRSMADRVLEFSDGCLVRVGSLAIEARGRDD